MSTTEDGIVEPHGGVEPLRLLACPGGPGREIVLVFEFPGPQFLLDRFQEFADALGIFIVLRQLDEFLRPFQFPVEGLEGFPVSPALVVLGQLESRQEEQFQCIAQAVFDFP